MATRHTHTVGVATIRTSRSTIRGRTITAAEVIIRSSFTVAAAAAFMLQVVVVFTVEVVEAMVAAAAIAEPHWPSLLEGTERQKRTAPDRDTIRRRFFI